MYNMLVSTCTYISKPIISVKYYHHLKYITIVLISCLIASVVRFGYWYKLNTSQYTK